MGDGFLTFVRISQASVLIPVVIAIFRYKRLSPEQRILSWLVFSLLLTEIIAFYGFTNFEAGKNHLLYNLYAIALFVFLNRIYRSILKEKLSAYLNLVLGLFLLFACYNGFFIQSIYVLNTNTIVVSFVTYIILSISYFYQMLKGPLDYDLECNPMFWLNSGILLYNSGALILFMYVNQFIEASDEVLLVSWQLNTAFNIMLNCFYGVALWVHQKR